MAQLFQRSLMAAAAALALRFASTSAASASDAAADAAGAAEDLIASSAGLPPSQASMEHAGGAYMHSAAERESDAEAVFREFTKKFKRSYRHGTHEYAMRQELFARRFSAVKSHNSKPNRLWKAGIGRFADFTEEERQAMRGWRRLGDGEISAGSILEKSVSKPLPETVSWMHLKTATNIRDQGACGSCWAISTISVLEAHYEIYHGVSKNFSSQQLLDCTPNPQQCGGSGGCQGATVELGMAWILKKGITTEEKEPYLAVDSKCTIDSNKGHSQGDDSGIPNMQVLEAMGKRRPAVEPALFTSMKLGMRGYATLMSNADQPLAEAVAQYGPIAVSAAASAWFDYQNGVFDGCEKDAVVDHAITLYGYGIDQGHKYWLIRNSWGADWGEKGFIRILRHEHGEKYCGTDDDPAQGTGCIGGPKEVTVCGMCGILYDSVVPYFSINASTHPLPQVHKPYVTEPREASDDSGSDSGDADNDDVAEDREIRDEAGDHRVIEGAKKRRHHHKRSHSKSKGTDNAGAKKDKEIAAPVLLRRETDAHDATPRLARREAAQHRFQ